MTLLEAVKGMRAALEEMAETQPQAERVAKLSRRALRGLLESGPLVEDATLDKALEAGGIRGTEWGVVAKVFTVLDAKLRGTP